MHFVMHQIFVIVLLSVNTENRLVLSYARSRASTPRASFGAAMSRARRLSHEAVSFFCCAHNRCRGMFYSLCTDAYRRLSNHFQITFASVFRFPLSSMRKNTNWQYQSWKNPDFCFSQFVVVDKLSDLIYLSSISPQERQSLVSSIQPISQAFQHLYIRKNVFYNEDLWFPRISAAPSYDS